MAVCFLWKKQNGARSEGNRFMQHGEFERSQIPEGRFLNRQTLRDEIVIAS